MSTLHVIWDPNDRISHNAEQVKMAGIKVALCPMAQDINDQELDAAIAMLTETIMAAINSE